MGIRRCLFCLDDSERSISVEHIVPESLGNTELVLPPGFVCDRCNNYFARKVEAPFLQSPAVLALRHIQGIPNKRGRIPGLDVILEDGTGGRLEWHPRASVPFRLRVELSAADKWISGQGRSPTSVYFPSPDKPAPTREVARFVAKVGLEHLVYRNLGFPSGLESIFGAPELEPARKFARYGQGPKHWAVRVERIYQPDHLFEENLPDSQRVWEMDLLIPDDGESALFAMSVFGLEFAINLTGPDLSSYDKWRQRSNAPSLLYPQGVPTDLHRP